MKIKGIKKIVCLDEELSNYDFTGEFNEGGTSKVLADIFIYSYKREGYEGGGYAVWRYEDKWRYQDLGHCSCNGPFEDIQTSDNAKFTKQEVIDILSNQWNKERTQEIIKEMKKYK
jgi:hypothetical protein